jgi:opacity protein-like surface antigen
MIRKILAAAFACSLAAPANAIDGVSLEGGHSSDDDVSVARVALQWHTRYRWLYTELSFGGWNGGRDRVYDLGFTPVARWGRSRYLEAGVGAHVLSDLDVGNGTEFSTHFQFGDHIGAGFRFGERERYDLGLRFQHLSNGGMRNPNPGINFLILRLQYHLG